ncbi:MAG TPA: DUF4079 family protein [Candidatus Thermoplasmatota archaeon]
MSDVGAGIPWWAHPVIAGAAVALTGLAVYLGRRSARAPTESYAPILRLHIACAATAIALATAAALIGISVVDETKVVDDFETPHAFVGVAAAALWAAQGALGLTLWHEKEGARKAHRANGFLVLSLGLLQAPLGYALAVLFL